MNGLISSASLACPECRAEIVLEFTALVCRRCRATYPIEDGVPILVASKQRSNIQKEHQTTFFSSEVDAEFEISRPHGAPALYGWLLGEKFRRSVSAIGPTLREATALCVCAGSGMDAEFLARLGARVIAADISPGAAHRARQRARRYRVDISPLVADIERLPFADASIDLVYVHDGLHHLERPLEGLAEMCRVARLAVSVTEPARAAVTAAAVKVGLALEREEAGNRVARLTLGEIEAELERHGFAVIGAERYGMYYRHEPGRAVRWLSAPGLFGLATVSFSALNRLGGRFGNKLTVQAVRRDQRRADRMVPG